MTFLYSKETLAQTSVVRMRGEGVCSSRGTENKGQSMVPTLDTSSSVGGAKAHTCAHVHLKNTQGQHINSFKHRIASTVLGS